ncbi:hypothetical protein ACUYFE_05255 [Olegusella massiliensis]|uniref:hypothetical protein n=1 Tax=Olegusella massiliensis TaxID=1776381 RepID=UPI0040554B6D
MAKHEANNTSQPPHISADMLPDPAQGSLEGNAIAVEATPDVRRGVHADIAMIRTNGGQSMIDFVLVDTPPVADGTASGVLSSRVFMSNESLVTLRDTLIEYTQNWQ